MITVAEKRCSVCAVTKPAAAFQENKGTKCGLRAECTECRRRLYRENYKTKGKPCKHCGVVICRQGDHRMRPLRFCSLACSFWHHVQEPNERGCREWSSTTDARGYGMVTFHGQHKAHRVALEFALGRQIGDGLGALHKCDNPPCVAADHLFEGTQTDNMADCKAKGRMVKPPCNPRRGEAHRGAKFTEEQIRRIKVMHLAGFSSNQIAAALIEKQSTISAIVVGRSWKHVTP